MRITEARMVQQATASVSKARERVAHAGEVLQTGVEVSRAHEDPAAWAQGMRQKARLTVSGDHRRSVERAQSKLEATDEALGRIGEALERVRELALQFANPTHTAGSRAGGAVEVDGLLQEALGAANARGLDGEYLLAGGVGDAPAFDAAGVYQGDDQIRAIEVGEGLLQAVTVPGSLLTAASGVDIFATMEGLSTALAANDVPGIQATLAGLASSIDQVSQARTTAGTHHNGLTSAATALDSFEQQLGESLQLSVLSDPVEAASELTILQSQLENSRMAAEVIVRIANDTT